MPGDGSAGNNSRRVCGAPLLPTSTSTPTIWSADRFTQPDSIRLAGGFNLYQYAPNPLRWVDPWGWICNVTANRGQYRDFEAEVKKHIQKYGTVDIEWKFVYGNGGTRPTEIHYDVFQNGKKVLGDIFNN